jgi:APA family basic amino acid/polyamine antiporter
MTASPTEPSSPDLAPPRAMPTSPGASASTNANTLARTLRERDITLLFIGAVIGSGIFIVPATVLRQLQGAFGLAIAVWIAGGVLSLLGALTYAELGAAKPSSGGLYVYIRDGFGPFPAFLYGWTLFFLISSSSTATLAVAFSAYLGAIVPLSWGAAKAVSLAMIASVAAVNILGTRRSADFQNWTTGLKVGGIALMGLAMLWWGFNEPSLTVWSTGSAMVDGVPIGSMSGGLLPVLAGVGMSMIGVLWAYEGWQYATFNAGETIDPQKALPRAFVIGSCVLIAVYLIANIGYVAALGVDGAAASTSIAVAAVEAIAGPTAAKLVAVMILISIASAANSLMLTSPRVYYAMSRDGLFFQRLAEVHPRFGTPAFAIAAGASWSMLLALSGTFDQLLTFVVFSGWIFYGLAAASIFVYRRHDGALASARPFSVPGYPLTPLLFIFSAAAVVASTLILAPIRGLIGLAIVSLGAPAYFIWRRPGRNDAR